MTRKVNFRSRQAYLRWLRYGHAKKLFKKKETEVYINGVKHNVKH